MIVRALNNIFRDRAGPTLKVEAFQWRNKTTAVLFRFFNRARLFLRKKSPPQTDVLYGIRVQRVDTLYPAYI